MIDGTEVNWSYLAIFVLWFLVGLSSYYFLKHTMIKSQTAEMVTEDNEEKSMLSKRNPFLRSCKNETSEPINGKVTGEIPAWLKGSLLRNGPGLMEIGPDKYKHAFDGLALIHRFFIKDGMATYQNAFLRSKAYIRNMRANRIVANEFGTVGFPDPCMTIFEKLMSFFHKDEIDNDDVNVLKIGDEYYAATETTVIHKFDPETLETKDRVSISDFLSVNTATAHPHYEDDGTVINMGSCFTSGRPKYCLIKFPPKTAEKNSFEASSVLCRIPSSRALTPSYYHSFAVTPHFCVFVEQSLVLSAPKLAFSMFRKAYSEILVWQPNEMTRFHVVKKDTGEILPLHFVADPIMVFHHINAYEEGETLVMDMCCYHDDEIVRSLYVSHLEASVHPKTKDTIKPVRSETRRYILPLNIQLFNDSKDEPRKITFAGSKACAVLKSDNSIWCVPEELTRDFDMVEMPQINYEKYNGKKYDHFYGICRKGANPGLIKANLSTGEHILWNESGTIPSEPVFVASPNATSEDDGVVLSALLHTDDDRKVTLLINDGKTFHEKARVEFTTTSAVPNDFHGIFVS